MSNLVSVENLEKILDSIKSNILEKIDSKDITEEQKEILNKVSGIITDGDGGSLLSDDSSYKEIDLEKLNESIQKTKDVWDLFKIEKQEQEKWEEKSPIITARGYTNGVVYGDNFFVIGGYNGKQVEKNEKYNILTDTWSSMSNMLTAKSSYGISIYNDNIYCLLGGDDRYVLSDVQCYNITSNTWETKTSAPLGSCYCTASIYKNKIYVMGGTATNSNQIYNCDTNTWSQGSNMISNRISSGSITNKNNIYIIGGETSNSSTQFSNNEVYNCDTDTWTSKTNMITARVGLRLSTFNNYIFAIGGWLNNVGVLSNNEMYDIQTDTWFTKSPLPYSNEGFAIGYWKGSIITATGGVHPSYTNRTFKYCIYSLSYDLELPSTIQDRLNVLDVSGNGTKALSDNGTYVDIPKGYRNMTDEEVNDFVSKITAVDVESEEV